MITKILFPLLITAALLSSCSGGAPTPSADAIRAAEQGQTDAAALCDTVLSTHSLQAALLAVRAREWQMRADSADEVADAYIDAFRTYLTDHNSDLASQLF